MLRIAKMLGLCTAAIFLINAIVTIATYKNGWNIFWLFVDVILGVFIAILEGPEFISCTAFAFCAVVTNYLEAPLYRFIFYLVLNLVWIGVGQNNWLAGIFTLLSTLVWAYVAFFDKPAPGLTTVAETQPVVA